MHEMFSSLFLCVVYKQDGHGHCARTKAKTYYCSVCSPRRPYSNVIAVVSILLEKMEEHDQASVHIQV